MRSSDGCTDRPTNRDTSFQWESFSAGEARAVMTGNTSLNADRLARSWVDTRRGAGMSCGGLQRTHNNTGN